MSVPTKLLAAALWQLVQYDIRTFLFGFRHIHSHLAGAGPEAQPEATVEVLCAAMNLAVALYWKPVRCLQKSAATTRLLRRYGWRGQLLIGYRAVPFFSHAWVEIDGRVVNDSPVYRKRLRILESV